MLILSFIQNVCYKPCVMALEDDVGTKTGALTLSGVTVDTALAGFDVAVGCWIRTVDLL